LFLQQTPGDVPAVFVFWLGIIIFTKRVFIFLTLLKHIISYLGTIEPNEKKRKKSSKYNDVPSNIQYSSYSFLPNFRDEWFHFGAAKNTPQQHRS